MTLREAKWRNTAIIFMIYCVFTVVVYTWLLLKFSVTPDPTEIMSCSKNGYLITLQHFP